MLTLSFATGCEPGKWLRRYRQTTAHGGVEAAASDDPVAEVLDGRVTLALVRLPDPRVEAALGELHKVELYDEAPGVAVPKDSVFAELGEAVRFADLEDETVHYRPAADGTVDIAQVRTMLPVVGANVGVVLAPRPVLKVLAKRQVVPLTLADAAQAGVVPTRVALVWRREADSDAVQDFVGVAKGRTANSTRRANPRGARGSGGRGGARNDKTGKNGKACKGAMAGKGAKAGKGAGTGNDRKGKGPRKSGRSGRGGGRPGRGRGGRGGRGRR